MSTTTANPLPVSHKRLWFGFAASAGAWILAGLLNVIVAWAACNARENGNWFTQPIVWILLGIVTFGLLAVAVASGVTSYRNWQQLKTENTDDPMFAEARARGEYMAMFGMIVAVSLGVGILWFCIPIYVLGMCVRIR